MRSSTSSRLGDYAFKIITLGSPAVGKTSLIRRFADNKFLEDYKTTLGVDITTKNIILKKEIYVTLLCVDPGGQDFFGKLRPVYYRGARGAVILFDLTRRSTFEDLHHWKAEFQSEVGEDIPLSIVGNKSDLEPQVTDEEIKEVADLFKCKKWYLTSAKTGANVINVYHDLALEILFEKENNT